MDVQVSPTSVMRLMRPVRGRGGFQELLRKLQPRISGTTLSIDLADLQTLNRYSHSYGRGGFQGRTAPPSQQAQQLFNFES